MLFATIMMAGCITEGESEDCDLPVEVSLAFSVSDNSKTATTRQSDVVVQEGSARALQELIIIPFDVRRKVVDSDVARPTDIGIDKTTYNRTNAYFYLFDKCVFLPGIASFLVYGKAQPVSGGDAVNGALVANFPADLSPAGITFSPKQIRSTTDIHADAQAIANYLTTIARTDGWSTTTDSYLQAYYKNFIGQGSEDLSLIAGSSKNVEKNVAYLKALLQARPQSDLRDAIIANIDQSYPNDYPGSIGLPDGAAALRWEIPAGKTEYAFVPQTVTTTEAAINSLTRYVYPAELYYYGNSRICTSNMDDRKIYYNRGSWGTSNSDENTVLSGFEYDPGVITRNTTAVAIKDPVQYAVARLDVKIKAYATSLKDAKDISVSITNNNAPAFPLTGIIVGGQHTVGFDFAPTEDDDANARFVYDNQVNTNTGNTPFCLSLEEQGPTRTLLLQSQEGKDVTIILEFRNDSDTDFMGLSGIVYKGTKFYLVGQLKLSEATGTDNTRVFTQDQTTTATLVVNGLAKAYNVVPNLLSPQLEIGVQLTTKWEQTTPTVVVMQ